MSLENLDFESQAAACKEHIGDKAEVETGSERDFVIMRYER